MSFSTMKAKCLSLSVQLSKQSPPSGHRAWHASTILMGDKKQGSGCMPKAHFTQFTHTARLDHQLQDNICFLTADRTNGSRSCKQNYVLSSSLSKQHTYTEKPEHIPWAVLLDKNSWIRPFIWIHSKICFFFFKKFFQGPFTILPPSLIQIHWVVSSYPTNKPPNRHVKT